MEKLVYVLWRDPETDVDQFAANLLGPVAGKLAELGACGIQINVADSLVADAMLRLSTFDVPVAAVVSLWVHRCADSVRLPLEEALAGASVRVEGWLVTESVPLEPPLARAGERQQGLAQIALVRRPEDLDSAAWLDRWQNHHTNVAIEMQSTFGYVQNAVVRPVTPGAPRVDAIVEELFPIEALKDPHAFYDSGGRGAELARRVTAMVDSVRSFGADRNLDVIPTSRYVFSSPFVGDLEGVDV